MKLFNSYCRQFLAVGIVVLVPACESDGSSSNETLGTALGALGGAIVGGIIDDGGAGGIFIGAAVGGLVGNRVGAYLDEREQEALQEATVEALDTRDVGEIVSWEASDEDGEVTASGWIIPQTDEYDIDGQTCRDVEQVVIKDGARHEQNLTSCRSFESRSGWIIPESA